MREIQLFPLVLLVLLSVLVKLEAQNVIELTPQKVEEFTAQKRRYFVMIESPQSPPNLAEQMIQGIWEPLASRYSQEIFTHLKCAKYRKLCYQLSTKGRIQQLDVSHKGVDILTISYSPTRKSQRRVELYMSGPDWNVFVSYIRHHIEQPLPYEPLPKKEIEQQFPPFPARHFKLAILVLATDGFVLPDVWDAFFQTIEGQDDILVLMHNKYGQEHNCRYPHVHVIPPIFTDRMTTALIHPVIQLLRFALVAGGADRYVLVSGNSVPLLSAPDLLHRLSTEAMYNGTNCFETHGQAFSLQNPVLRNPQLYTTTDDGSTVSKSKNWIILNDTTAKWFADHGPFKLENWELTGVPDEYFWIAMAKAHDFTYTTEAPVMYDVWDDKIPTVRPFDLWHVNASLTEKGHLFARKVVPETVVDLTWYKSSTKAPMDKDEL